MAWQPCALWRVSNTARWKVAWAYDYVARHDMSSVHSKPECGCDFGAAGRRCADVVAFEKVAKGRPLSRIYGQDPSVAPISLARLDTNTQTHRRPDILLNITSACLQFKFRRGLPCRSSTAGLLSTCRCT